MSLVACVATPLRPALSPAPSALRAEEALDAVNLRARRCLAEGQQVSVHGFFDGGSGSFLVEHIASPSAPVRVQQCVSLAMERARVSPFNAERYDAHWTVSLNLVSPAETDVPAPSGDQNATVGEVDAVAVMALLRVEATEAQRCYEDALRGRPSLSGRVEVRLTLSVDGHVTHAVASGPRGFRAVGHCILGHLRQLSWPAARGAPVDFVFPYQFSP